MINYGQLYLDTCLVKIMVEVYVQQKNMYKIFGGSVVAVAFQKKFTWKHIKIIFIFLFFKNYF